MCSRLCGNRAHSSIAQSVEHAAVNRGVVGSSPTGGAKQKRTPKGVLFCLSIPRGSRRRPCATAASRLLIGSGTAAAGGRERRCLSRKKQGVPRRDSKRDDYVSDRDPRAAAGGRERRCLSRKKQGVPRRDSKRKALRAGKGDGFGGARRFDRRRRIAKPCMAPWRAQVLLTQAIDQRNAASRRRMAAISCFYCGRPGGNGPDKGLEAQRGGTAIFSLLPYT